MANLKIYLLSLTVAGSICLTSCNFDCSVTTNHVHIYTDGSKFLYSSDEEKEGYKKLDKYVEVGDFSDYLIENNLFPISVMKKRMLDYTDSDGVYKEAYHYDEKMDDYFYRELDLVESKEYTGFGDIGTSYKYKVWSVFCEDGVCSKSVILVDDISFLEDGYFVCPDDFIELDNPEKGYFNKGEFVKKYK